MNHIFMISRLAGSRQSVQKGAGDLQAQRIIKAFSLCPIPTRSPARDDSGSGHPYRHVKKGARLTPQVV